MAGGRPPLRAVSRRRYHLSGARAAFLGLKEGVAAVLVATISEVGPEGLLGAEGAAAVEGKCLGARGGIAGVVFLDPTVDAEMAVLEVEHLYGELGGFATAEPGVVEECDDRLVAGPVVAVVGGLRMSSTCAGFGREMFVFVEPTVSRPLAI
jgi:hypothetical protein